VIYPDIMDRSADRHKPDNIGLFEFIKQLPPNMGWGPITAEKRRLMGLLPDPASKPEPEIAIEADPALEPNHQRSETIKIFGHVLDAIHRHKRDGCGRVWLLMRHLDSEKGEGRIEAAKLRYAICAPAGKLRCLSKKRLQQILRVGEGLFWHRSTDGRWLHYHSESRVAVALRLTAVKGIAVKLPIVKLLQKIRLVRAVFYNAFHSARGDGFNNPITRRTMHGRGMRDPRTQRKYEAAEGIFKRSEFAVIEKYTKLAWQRVQYEDTEERVGGPAFIYVDYKGVMGKNPDRFKRPVHQRHWHNIYIVRQIGNAYAGTLESPKRGRGWTNQKISYLCQSMPEITGSADIDSSVDECEEWLGKCYYESDKRLEKALEKNGEGESRPLYHPCLDVDLSWNMDKPLEMHSLSESGAFYWQEAVFLA